MANGDVLGVGDRSALGSAGVGFFLDMVGSLRLYNAIVRCEKMNWINEKATSDAEAISDADAFADADARSAATARI